MTKSTRDSASSSRQRLFDAAEFLAALVVAGAVCAAAVVWFHAHGYLLYYGDASAHLNIARSVTDSRTPSWEQVGTVWLPVPHWAMIPFARNDEWWRTGLAGAIPAAAANTAAAALLFVFSKRLMGSSGAGWVTLAVWLSNPNQLYLGSTAMTEAFFTAAFAATLVLLTFVKDSGSFCTAGLAGVAAATAALTRYEGWFLIPFLFLFLLFVAPAHRWGIALLFAIVASMGPAYWLAHNYYVIGDPLDFYRGPYSPRAIQGSADYPGRGELIQATRQFIAAVYLVAGPVLSGLGLLGVLGLAANLQKRTQRSELNKRTPRSLWLFVLALPPIFYILSLVTSGTPIFVPTLWPFSFYNTRYGLAAMPLLAVAAGSLVALLPGIRWRAAGALAVIGLAVAPWWTNPNPDSWVCLKESHVNSDARREWTRQAAQFLKAAYRGGGIAASFSDLTGIFRDAGIPLRETLHEGNSPHWLGVLARPDLFLREEWAVTIAGDRLAAAIWKAYPTGPIYEPVRLIIVKGAPVIEIYRRSSGHGLRRPTEEEIRESEEAMVGAEEK